jgi:polyisoprenoid-binding protein YceI
MLRKLLSLLILVPAIATAGNPGGKPAHVDTYKVDTQNSKVEWFAAKVTGKHNGTINMASGELHNNHGRFAGKFVMDMSSIIVSDLTGSGKTKLENHLKSDDFFSSEKNATSTFEVTSITPLSGVEQGKPNFTVNGKLTIKGITQDVSFPALIRFNGPAMTASGEMVVDRTKFDIRYGSKSFFADIGDKAIYDEFTLKFDIKAAL